MEPLQLVSAAGKWMRARGWNAKLAKRRGYEQSLLEHSLIELDVVLTLLPILAHPKHFGFSEAEQRILTVAVVVHDLGKETDEWQAYLRDSGRGPFVSHVLPDLTRAIVPDLCRVLEFDDLSDPVQRIIGHCATFHHSRPGRSDGAIMEALLSGGSDRFMTLAQLVKTVDHFCSASGPAEAIHVIHSDAALSPHLKITRHELALRGVSSTFLHRAAQTAFEREGWKPILYFPAGTVYVADPLETSMIPAPSIICGLLKEEMGSALARDVAGLMVGSPLGNILPKPDLFSFAESSIYLATAGAKMSTVSLARKPLKARRKVVEEYWRQKGKTEAPGDADVESESARLSVAQPEMLVFKFFKAMVDPDKVSAVGAAGQALAAKLYEARFGAGSWGNLMSTSTLMPAKDMTRTVDLFWSLPGSAVGQPAVASVAELPNETRLQLLVAILDDIAQQVYAACGKASPRETLAIEISNAFSRDLIQPAVSSNIRAAVEIQLAHYADSKRFAGKETSRAIYLCPICNSPFSRDSGRKASADFIDNPQTHTNRGIANGPFGYVMVCRTCYYERLLIQILLGLRPQEIITIRPRLNLGPIKGTQLARDIRQWIEAAQLQMRGGVGAVDKGFSFGLTDQTARQMDGQDPFSLEPSQLLSLFSYRFAEKTQKDRRRDVLKRLKKEFDDDIGVLNIACNEAFATWEDAVEAIYQDRVQQNDVQMIRQEVFRLEETVHLICQTPNVVFIPLKYEIASGKDESETSKSLQRLYVSLILGSILESAVAIHKEGEPVDSDPGMGVARVPSTPAVRSLVKHDWIPITEASRWISAIGAASLLVRDTSLPPRSALYQILSADPAERLARRIEEASGHDLNRKQIRLIERLPGFQNVQQEGLA